MSFKLVGIMDEDPFDPGTWSGSSVYFFEALKKRGVLTGAIAASPPRVQQLFYKMISIQPDMARWKFKYYLNLGYYRAMTRAAEKRLAVFADKDYEVILQVGAWYDMTGYRGKPVVSYHDGNLATLLKSPYGYPGISRAYINRTLEYERQLYDRIRLIFPMSRWLADSFMNDNGMPGTKVFPVGAGINLPLIRDVSGKNYEAPRILYVGKDFQRKGGSDLLAAFAMVRKEIKDAELTIIGPQLESAPEGVRCVGFLSKANESGLERLLDEYERASIFVLPSLYEPFGIVFAEAMAHRLPCIGTNICAMPEIIDSGETGYVVPPREPAVLAKHIVMLLREPDVCRTFGNRGFEKYRAQFTWESVVARITDVIDREIIAGK